MTQQGRHRTNATVGGLPSINSRLRTHIGTEGAQLLQGCPSRPRQAPGPAARGARRRSAALARARRRARHRPVPSPHTASGSGSGGALVAGGAGRWPGARPGGRGRSEAGVQSWAGSSRAQYFILYYSVAGKV